MVHITWFIVRWSHNEMKWYWQKKQSNKTNMIIIVSIPKYQVTIQRSSSWAISKCRELKMNIGLYFLLNPQSTVQWGDKGDWERVNQSDVRPSFRGQASKVISFSGAIMFQTLWIVCWQVDFCHLANLQNVYFRFNNVAMALLLSLRSILHRCRDRHCHRGRLV